MSDSFAGLRIRSKGCAFLLRLSANFCSLRFGLLPEICRCMLLDIGILPYASAA